MKLQYVNKKEELKKKDIATTTEANLLAKR
jgi:hypothetical protein